MSFPKTVFPLSWGKWYSITSRLGILGDFFELPPVSLTGHMPLHYSINVLADWLIISLALAAHFASPCLCTNSYSPLLSLVPASFWIFISYYIHCVAIIHNLASRQQIIPWFTWSMIYFAFKSMMAWWGYWWEQYPKDEPILGFFPNTSFKILLKLDSFQHQLSKSSGPKEMNTNTIRWHLIEPLSCWDSAAEG